MSKRYFITGTGTGVGKTFVTAVINRYLQEQGKKVLVIKPVQTGAIKLDSGERISCDIRFVENFAKDPLILSQEEACFFLYDLPASPHLSVEDKHQEVSPLIPAVSSQTIIDKVAELEAKYQPDITIIEGAGGLFVPLNPSYEMMIDLIPKLDCQAILVSSAILGTLNHTLLSVEAMKARKIDLHSICLNSYDEKEVIAEDNLKTLRALLDTEIFTIDDQGVFDTEANDSIDTDLSKIDFPQF